MGHLALLGDSTLDNAAYVGAGPALVEQVRERLPARWEVTLLAVDGSLIADVSGQLAALGEAISHLVVSVGGNDLLTDLSILGARVGTVGEGLRRLAAIRDRFEENYARMLRAVEAAGRPAALCTIYNPRFTDEVLGREATTALALFDDAIIRAGRREGLPVLDLRAVCTAEDDFATPIEPSAAGGAKIARAIGNVLLQHDFTRKRSAIWP
jgi:lysophospholipase L1-like esterase